MDGVGSLRCSSEDNHFSGSFISKIHTLEYKGDIVADALNIGLVDTIGGLQDAINYAASAIGASDFCVLEYPKPLTTMESIMAAIAQTSEHDYVKAFQKLSEPQVIARMPYQVVVY